MAANKPNTKFRERLCGLRTDLGLVGKAMNDPEDFNTLMKGYRTPSWGYLGWFLESHKITVDPAIRNTVIQLIWDGVIATMPGRLKSKWSKGNVSFRALLCEAIHESCHNWQKMNTYRPGIDGLASPIPGNDTELLRWQRGKVLADARERLRHGDRNELGKHYYAFLSWEMDKTASRNVQNANMANLTGRRRLNEADYRQTLRRAWDRFGRYLAEGVELLFEEKEDLSVEKFREAFEKLDLMDDYALKSQHCRLLLGLELENDQ